MFVPAKRRRVAFKVMLPDFRHEIDAVERRRRQSGGILLLLFQGKRHIKIRFRAPERVASALGGQEQRPPLGFRVLPHDKLHGRDGIQFRQFVEVRARERGDRLGLGLRQLGAGLGLPLGVGRGGVRLGKVMNADRADERFDIGQRLKPGAFRKTGQHEAARQVPIMQFVIAHHVKDDALAQGGGAMQIAIQHRLARADLAGVGPQGFDHAHGGRDEAHILRPGFLCRALLILIGAPRQGLEANAVQLQRLEANADQLAVPLDVWATLRAFARRRVDKEAIAGEVGRVVLNHRRHVLRQVLRREAHDLKRGRGVEHMPGRDQATGQAGSRDGANGENRPPRLHLGGHLRLGGGLRQTRERNGRRGGGGGGGGGGFSGGGLEIGYVVRGASPFAAVGFHLARRQAEPRRRRAARQRRVQIVMGCINGSHRIGSLGGRQRGDFGREPEGGFAALIVKGKAGTDQVTIQPGARRVRQAGIDAVDAHCGSSFRHTRHGGSQRPDGSHGRG